MFTGVDQVGNPLSVSGAILPKVQSLRIRTVPYGAVLVVELILPKCEHNFSVWRHARPTPLLIPQNHAVMRERRNLSRQYPPPRCVMRYASLVSVAKGKIVRWNRNGVGLA